MALNESDMLGGKAIIFQNDFDIWQFRTWVSEEKQYVRKSLRTKDKHQTWDLNPGTRIMITHPKHKNNIL